MATKDQLIASAQKNLEKGNIKKAIKDYQELLQLEPKVDQHKQKLADLLCRVNLKEDALSLYDSLAKNYADRGFAAKAVAVYKQMQRLDPASPDVYLRLAELNRSLGLIGNAMSEYRSLLEIYEKRNLGADASGVLQKMADLEPENITLQLRVLQSLLKEKLFVKATETTLKACEACAKSGDSAKSQKILQSILSHLPDNVEFHTEIAKKLSAANLFADAIFVYQSLSKSSPQEAVILTELAKLYGKIDDAESEIPLLEQILSVQPTKVVAERLVRLCLAKGDDNRARRALKEHEACLDDENHTLLTELAQELEGHQGGSQQVTPVVAEGFVSPRDEGSLLETAEEELSVGNEEFELDDLLPSLPHTEEAEPPQPEEIVPDDLLNVSIELPLEDVSFDDIDTFAEDVALEIPAKDLAVEAFDTLEEPAALSVTEEIKAEAAVLPLINIEFDFSEFDDLEVEPEVENVADTSLVLEIGPAVAEDIDQVETDNRGDLSPEAEAEEEEIEDIEELELELLDEIGDEEDVVDEEEILELEPLEEEDELVAGLSDLEDLLDAEMEEVSRQELSVFKVTVDEAAVNTSEEDDDFFDLAADILDDGALQATEDLANVDENDRFRFDSVFAEFKKGVDAQIDHDDTEAHYDLGIAYKEMGLMDDAIEEFKKSMRSLKRLADSLILIGICYAEKGAFADAEAVFSTAIGRPEVQEADKIGTQYELGLVYEVWGRPADALRTFETIAKVDPCFRNVVEKIEALRLLVDAGSSQSLGATPGSASPGKNRVSFV